MTATKMTLSGSTDGLGVLVAATSTPGTTIHTGPSAPSVLDEVWLWACNTSSNDVLLTIEYGGATASYQIVQTIVARAGAFQICPGLLIKSNASPHVVKAFAATANVVNIHGFVNRIS